MSGSEREAEAEAEAGSPPPCKKLRVDNGEGTDDLGDPGSPGHVATEAEVGIDEFSSEHEGFFAILKRRYSDFMVHELAEDGSVVKFTSRSLPFEADTEDEGDEASLVQLLGSETVLSIKELSESPSDKQVEVTVPLDKAERTILHKTVRALYPLLESATVEPAAAAAAASTSGSSKPEHKNIVIKHAKKTGGKNNSNSRGAWPRERGSYCQCVLYKENKDTMEAVSVISRLLKIKSGCFQYAGVKDRRAITCQLLTAFKVTAEKLQTLNPRLRNMQLGNFKYVPNSMKLGSLSGNKFTVVLRNVSCEDHVISRAVKSLGEVGFVNYYGMQRFGTSVIPTHHIGRCLIHSDWKGAIDLVLKPRSGELGEVEHAREYYHTTGDVEGTLFRMPKARYIERQLLVGVQKHAMLHNYLGAFNFIPRNTRLMYVHSWQSFCWNHLASWRLRELGRSPVIGDLVKKNRFARNSSEPEAVKYVTAENKAEYDIHDVVLPLPGYDILLPDNAAKGEYERVLTKEGVTMENLKNRVKDMSLVGSYRHVVVKPRDIDWQVLLYDDFSIPLVLTDLDLFTGKKPPQSLPEGSLKAVKVEFSLPSSCYATMAIRELLKMDTSPTFQTSLNETACDSTATATELEGHV